MAPSYKPHIELGPTALMGFSPPCLVASGQPEWAHCAGVVVVVVWGGLGILPRSRDGEALGAALEYLLECIPQLLVCVLRERVQILPHGAREENRVLGTEGGTKRERMGERKRAFFLNGAASRLKGLRQALQSCRIQEGGATTANLPHNNAISDKFK